MINSISNGNTDKKLTSDKSENHEANNKEIDHTSNYNVNEANVSLDVDVYNYDLQ